MPRNQWTAYSGISGRHGPESVDDFHRIMRLEQYGSQEDKVIITGLSIATIRNRYAGVRYTKEDKIADAIRIDDRPSAWYIPAQHARKMKARAKQSQ